MRRDEGADRDGRPFPSGGSGDLLGWLLSRGPWVAFAVDERGRLSWWNERLPAVTGRDRDCLDGLPATGLFASDPDSAQDGLCAAVEAVDGVELDVEAVDGRTLPHEFRGTTRDGAVEHRYLYAGRPSGECGSEADESSRHRRIVETIHDGVFTLDGDWNLVDVNRPLAAMLGRDRSTLVGTHTTELLAPDGSVERARRVWEALQRGEVESGSVELTVVRADGSRFPAEVRYGRFPLPVGVGAVGVVRDVTEREEREARLRDHRDQLARLNRIGDAAAAALDPVLEAGSREEIERRVCERLADTDLYDVVWVGRPDGSSIVPQVTLGADSRFHELAERLVEASVHERTAERAFRRGEPIVRHEDWDTELGEMFREAVGGTDLRATMAVPIAYRGTTYEVLTAYSTREDAFSEGERQALVRLGRAVGFAISAVGTRRLIHAHERTELEFDVGPETSVLAAVSAALDAECVLVWSTPATDLDDDRDGGDERARSAPSEASPHDLWLRVAVEGTDADAVLAAVDEVGAVESRVVETRETGCTVEIRAARSVLGYVVDAGGWPREVVADGGRVRVVAEVPTDADIRSVVEAFTDATGADLAAKRSLGSRPEGGSLAAALTEKQREAVRTAAEMGYFDWPREHTAEEVADRLGVASATFHYHLRAAQQTLVCAVADTTDYQEP